MVDINRIQIRTLSMVTKDRLQRIDIEYCCSRTVHLTLEVYRDKEKIIEGFPVALDSGNGVTTVMLPMQKDSFDAKWRFVDRKGNILAELNSSWNKPRQLTVYTMISSHTDIGLHNSPYIQRYNSSRFLDMAMQLCDETKDRDVNDQYRYTMEGTWFWNNYGMDRGRSVAEEVVREYLKQGRIGVCCGVAGNHTQVFGLEEMCRSTYERKRLKDEWSLECETMSMIDNNGMSMAMIQPYAEAGIKNIIFAPNQWNPLPSTIWKKDIHQAAATWNPNANGGGARIDIRYGSSLPMVFYWEDEVQNRILVWGSTQYEAGGTAFGLTAKGIPNSDTLKVMEECMAKQVPVLEEKYPYDIWLLACYCDDQEPGMELTDCIQAWNGKWMWPRIRTLGNPDEPFQHLREKYNDQITVIKGDITGGWYQHPLSTPELLAQKFEADRLLPTAEKWSTIASVLDKNYEYPAALYRRAWDYLLFNDEHSYGTSGYQGRRVYETWMQHRDWINKASTVAKSENNAALMSIAAKIVSEDKKSVVFNSTAVKRRELIKSENGERYCVVNIPAFGYKTVNESDYLHNVKAIEKVYEPPVIENKYYKIAFAKNGSINSVFDKELNRELLDLDNEFHANEMVYTKDNHRTFLVPDEAVFEITREAEKITVVVRTKEENLGAEIVQSVSLLNYEKRVDIDNHLYHVKDMVNKNRYYRYIYYAFPFAVDNCHRYCHLNGTVAEYAKDITGHGTDVYMAVNEWCCSENQDYGVALMMLDSQLVEFDHIHPDKTDFGDTGEGSQMFAYVANDWLQMHTPGGSHLDYRFRYSITSYQGNYKSAGIPQMAECYANPVQVVVIPKQTGMLDSDSYSFLQVNEGQRLICLKRSDDGNGMIARLYGDDVQVTFDNGFDLDLNPERVRIDETPLEKGIKFGDDAECVTRKGFHTYRLGRDILKLKERNVEIINGVNGAPAPIGSEYTGLITEPCAAAGENPGHLYLLWGQNMEEDFSHYKLYRSKDSEFEADEASFVADVMPEEYRVGRYEDTGLEEHTCYYYKVCAVNQNGQCSPMSKVFAGITKESLEE